MRRKHYLRIIDDPCDFHPSPLDAQVKINSLIYNPLQPMPSSVDGAKEITERLEKAIRRRKEQAEYDQKHWGADGINMLNLSNPRHVDTLKKQAWFLMGMPPEDVDKAIENLRRHIKERGMGNEA